jgi:hypothetical protein
MFELGMRLAFDKPTVIVKDDKTTYSFDTSAIEHLEYPRDLRFSRIVDFKKKLAEKIRATYKKATTDQNYTTFLKHFGEFKVAKLESKEVPGQELILDEIRSLNVAIRNLELRQNIARNAESMLTLSGISRIDSSCKMISLPIADWPKNKIRGTMVALQRNNNVESISIDEDSSGPMSMNIRLKPGVELTSIGDIIPTMISDGAMKGRS